VRLWSRRSAPTIGVTLQTRPDRLSRRSGRVCYYPVILRALPDASEVFQHLLSRGENRIGAVTPTAGRSFPSLMTD
jgi:hypothetical protein